MENVIITGMVEGRRGRGRPREKYRDGLGKLIGDGMTHLRLIRATSDREQWKSMVADVLQDMAQR